MICLIRDIIAAVGGEKLRLKTISNVKVERNTQNKPTYNVGNHVVIFKVTHNNLPCALRCYRRTPPNAPIIYKEKFCPNELSVESLDHNHELDVVLQPWRDGVTLTEAIEKGVVPLDGWNHLALEIVSAEWAHCDLSGDNIIVGDDGVLSLIDFDNAYTPNLHVNNNLGSRLFQSPMRRPSDFNARTDDFSILLISVALRALAHAPELRLKYPLSDGVLIDGSRVFDAKYKLLDEIAQLAIDMGDFVLYRMVSLLTRHALYFDELPRLLQFAAEGCEANDDLELFCEDGVWGYCDPNSGEQLIAPLFDKAYSFRGDTAQVMVGGRWFTINRRGEVL